MSTLKELFNPAAQKAIELKHDLGKLRADRVLIYAKCKKCNQVATIRIRDHLIFGGAADVECAGKDNLSFLDEEESNNLIKENGQMAKKVSLKDQLRKLFSNKKKRYTMEEIIAKLKTKANAIQTALYDLKNKKYAGAGGVMVIKKDDKKRYYRAGN